jgi:hypothetical protein
MATTKTDLRGAGRSAIRKDSETGAAAIAASMTAIKASRLVSVTLHIVVTPSTTEDYIITLNLAAGSAYDTNLLTLDLVGVTDNVFTVDEEIYLEPGDGIDVTYTNTDTRTYGVQITTIELV